MITPPTAAAPLRRDDLLENLRRRIDTLDVEQSRTEVARFVRDRSSLDLWSPDFFRQIIDRVQCV